MRHMVRIAVAVMVASLLAGVTLSADGNHELRIRRNQLVITSAMADCEAGILMASGMNFGSQPPHVTLALDELLNVAVDNDGVELQADLPASFCDDPGPGTYLLTVMRPGMKHRRRWLKLTKKDLGTFDVAIGVATLDDVTGLQSQIDANAGDIATNAADIATNVGAIATNVGAIGTNAGAIGTNAGAIGTNAGDIATNTTDIATNATAIAALGGGGGGGISGYSVEERTVSGNVADNLSSGSFGGAGTLEVFVPCPVGAKPLGGGGRHAVTGLGANTVKHLRLSASYATSGLNDDVPPVMVEGWRVQWRALKAGGTSAEVIGQAICATVAAP